MATRAPIDLGRPGFSYGRRNLMPGDIPQRDGGITLGDILQPTQAQQPDNRQSARNYALGEVLSNPIQVESGSWGEAIAEALAGGIRGRTMRAERERELGREEQDRAREQSNDDMQRRYTEARIAALERPEQSGPDPRINVTPDGTVMYLDPAQQSYRVLGRDPNWTPRRAAGGPPLVDDEWSYHD